MWPMRCDSETPAAEAEKRSAEERQGDVERHQVSLIKRNPHGYYSHLCPGEGCAICAWVIQILFGKKTA